MATKKSTTKKSAKKSTKVVSESTLEKANSKPVSHSSHPLTALILGGCALLFFWVPFLGFILAVLGLVFGIISINKKDVSSDHVGFSIGGIVLSSLSLFVQLIMIFLFLFSLSVFDLAQNIDGACVVNGSSVSCDNLSVVDDNSQFLIDLEVVDDELVSLNVDASSR